MTTDTMGNNPAPRPARRRLKPAHTALVGSAVLALLSAACSSSSKASSSVTTNPPATGGSATSSPSSGTATQTLTLGEIDSLTGGAAVYGVPQHMGIELAIDQINAAGGLKVGGTTYTLKLVTEDDKTDPQTGVAVVQKLISQDSIHFLVGTLSSEIASAYIPIIKNQNNLVDIIMGAAVDGITNSTPVYRPRIEAGQYTGNEVKWLSTLAKTNPFSRVALIYDQTHAGDVQQLSTLKQDMTNANFTISTTQSFSLGAAQFDSQIAALLRGNSQAVLFEGYAPDAATFIKEARGQGFQGPIVTNVGFAASDVKKANVPTSALANVYDLDAPVTPDFIKLNINAANAQAFQNAYQQKFNQPPGYTSASAFDGVYILAKALQNAGTTTDFSKIYAALDALKVSDVPNLAEVIVPQANGEIFNKHQSYFDVVVHEWDGTDWVTKALVG